MNSKFIITSIACAICLHHIHAMPQYLDMNPEVEFYGNLANFLYTLLTLATNFFLCIVLVFILYKQRKDQVYAWAALVLSTYWLYYIHRIGRGLAYGYDNPYLVRYFEACMLLFFLGVCLLVFHSVRKRKERRKLLLLEKNNQEKLNKLQQNYQKAHERFGLDAFIQIVEKTDFEIAHLNYKLEDEIVDEEARIVAIVARASFMSLKKELDNYAQSIVQLEENTPQELNELLELTKTN